MELGAAHCNFPPDSWNHGCTLQEFVVKGVSREDRLDAELKATYTAGKYSLATAVAQANGKVCISRRWLLYSVWCISSGVHLCVPQPLTLQINITGTYKDLVPGMSVAVSGVLQDTQSGKVNIVNFLYD